MREFGADNKGLIEFLADPVAVLQKGQQWFTSKPDLFINY